MSNTDRPEPLSGQEAQQIVNSLQRFQELNGASAIINPRDEAELTGLKNFFAAAMVKHGFELMGNWIAVRDEYEPLVQVVERVASRIVSIRDNRAKQTAAQREENSGGKV